MENKKTILITGIAGFIGFHLAKKLSVKFNIVGLDNLNDYYDIDLKKSRLKELGIHLKDHSELYRSSNLPIQFLG